jgi:glycosyltransferase involved in cell wall biosynthesis
MNIVVFGAGPMPCEPQFAVTAPGARTWQITKTIARALMSDPATAVGARIIVVGLEPADREVSADGIVFEARGATGGFLPVYYFPLGLESFMAAGRDGTAGQCLLPNDVHAVVGTASALPYSTAAQFATLRDAPLWLDIFGDPISEIQTQLIASSATSEESGNRLVHAWKLLCDALLRGDVFSALSSRQKHTLQGQLGCAGRLNRYTTDHRFVHTIPYGIFPDDIKTQTMPPRNPTGTFTVMWCGSFNTWMDVDTLLNGFLIASRRNPRLRLLVVGGKIPGYNEDGYARFVEGLRTAKAESAVQLLDWQPLARMKELYATCDVGLSIDRFSYEALLGSRTRIVNFLAAQKPVISTVITELTEDLARQGFVFPFTPGSAEDLARVLDDCTARTGDIPAIGQKAQAYVVKRYDADQCGESLAAWIRNPAHAPDLQESAEPNTLSQYWQAARATLA